MLFRVLTPPASLPVTVQELKDWARMTREDEDAILARALASAVTAVEAAWAHTGIVRTYELMLDDLCQRAIKLYYAPFAALTSFEIRSTPESAYATVDNGLYTCLPAGNFPATIVLRSDKSWPAIAAPEGGAVRIRYTTGYASATLVPDPYKEAVLRVATALWERKSAPDVSDLMAPYLGRELVA